MTRAYVDAETVKALSSLAPEHAAALYDPQTVVKLAREVEVLRIIASNLHPCSCVLAECLQCRAAGRDPVPHDRSATCSCACHQRIRDALLIWDPDRLPDHPDVVEGPAQ